jgi:hypothetical protein
MRVLKRLICFVGSPFVMCYGAIRWVATGKSPEDVIDEFFNWSTH